MAGINISRYLFSRLRTDQRKFNEISLTLCLQQRTKFLACAPGSWHSPGFSISFMLLTFSVISVRLLERGAQLNTWDLGYHTTLKF